MPQNKKFLFLQGPHGPFFRQLGQKLAATGAHVERVGFTFGDRVFWSRSLGFTAFPGSLNDWPEFLREKLAEGITDIVLYGDSRPLHQIARALATELNIKVHCFEEGYLRPYWATYERGGTNGNSALIELTVTEMQQAVEKHPIDLPETPVQWGAIWHHAYYGALYHALLSLPTKVFKNYRPHREISVLRELNLYLRLLALIPLQSVRRRVRTFRLLRSGAVYHLVLLQLSHDASLRSHSDFKSVEEFIKLVISEFESAAPQHHLLVFKAHPFEDGREPIQRIIRDEARSRGLERRLRFIPGGKLGPLLNAANSIVTVNSTAAQQALWRGLPVRAFGRSVFKKEEFVSSQPLADFFVSPDLPNSEAYYAYRQFLLETSQISGGFYTQKGRAELLRRLVDLVLSDDDPYSMILDRDLSA